MTIQVQEEQKQKPRVERIHVLKNYVVDRWIVLIPQQEVSIVEDQGGGDGSIGLQ